MNRPAVVCLTWNDSTGWKGWCKPEDCADGPSSIESIGFVVHETKEYITISTSYGTTGNFADPICIPKACITMRSDLKFNSGKSKKQI